MPKWVWWIVLILVIVWIVSNPTGAGNDVHTWVNDIISFFRHLANG
jgi:hypothetical protein